MKKKLLMNIGLMTVSNIAVRLIGVLYRIWLSRNISPVALGLFQLSMSLYMVLIAPVSSGLPSAVSRLSAKYQKTGKSDDVLLCGMRIGLFISILTGGLVICAGGFLSAAFLHQKSAWPVVLALLPAVTIGALAEIPCAYLHSQERSPISAGAEIAEQLAKIAFGMALITLLPGSGNVTGAALAALAVSFGGIISFWIQYAACGKRKHTGFGCTKELLTNAVPLTFSRLATTLLHLGNTTLLPLRLMVYGLTMEGALSQYGILTSMAYPVVFLPSTVISAICVVLLPEIAKCMGDQTLLKRKIRRALLSAFGICLLFCLFLLLFANKLAVSVFAQPLAGTYMLLLIPCVLFCGVNQVTGTTLSGLGCQTRLLIYNIIVGVIGIVTTFFFASAWGIIGFILGNIVQDILGFLLEGTGILAWFRKAAKT